MSITIQQLCAVADTLFGEGSEAHQRSGMSRHYYAAYHRCIEWGANLPMPGHALLGPKGGKHQQLINALKNPDATCPEGLKRRSRFIGAKLDILRGRRVSADYEIGQAMDPAHPAQQRQQTCGLIEECDKP